MRDVAEGRNNMAGERKIDYLEEVGRSMVVQSFIFFSEGACSIMHASANTLTTHLDHLKYAYVSEVKLYLVKHWLRRTIVHVL
jgi:hypothetical protein